jgi:predicted DNA-binding antitoxin AbrB/MazE fold protein
VNAASTTKAQLQKLTTEIQKQTPEPNEALQWLKNTATSYAAFIPGAKPYVDGAFKDLEKIQEKHGDEVNKIVSRTYDELKDASKKGVSMETAARSWEIIEKAVSELGQLAGDSANEILDNHPKVKEQVGGNLDKLKQMTDGYGGEEAKKELEQTYQQIKDVLKGGFSAETVTKIKKVIDEKTEKVKKLGDEAWKKGLEQAKPYLDKNPQVKKMVEENAESLKQGNVKEIFEQVKKAVETGDTDELKKYVKQAGDKARNTGLGQSIEGYAKMIPGGSEIVPQLMKLKEVAEKRGEEGQGILKGAYEDVKDVLKKRIGEAEKLAEKAKEDSK